MKKIVLGCAAVLLSLGLLAGCNNDTDSIVTISVDNTATVVVGETLELPYTVEPEKAKVEVLNDHEEHVTAETKDGVLSLEGVSAGSATVTLVGTYKKYTEANVNISVSVVTEKDADTEPGPGTGGSGSGYYFGFESDDVLYYITGGTQSEGAYRGEVTTDISEAVEVTFEVDTEVENAYYISFKYEEVKHWITIVAGDYTNLSYATEKAPIYLHTDGEAEYFGDESGENFLCYNATYGCLYASDIDRYLASSPVAGIYTASGELVAGGMGKTPEPLPEIDPDDLTEGDTGKLGLYQGGKGNYYYFTGTINDSGFGVLSTSWDAGFSVTELTDGEYVVLRIGEADSYQYIGAEDVNASRVALYDEPYALTYDEDHEAFLTAYGERFIGTYGTYETLSWSSASDYLGQEGQYAAQLYTEEQKLPAPASANITISGPNSVYVGSTITLTATVDAGYDQSIVWSTDDTTYATVDASTGVVTGVAVGTATIKATSVADSSAYATYTVEVVALPENVSLLGTFNFSTYSGTAGTIISEDNALDEFWSSNDYSNLYTCAREHDTVYLGNSSGGAFGSTKEYLKFGTDSLNGLLQLKFAVGTNITEVVVTAHSWSKSETDTLTINGTTQNCSQSGSVEPLTYTITDDWTYLLTMESSGRVFVQTIEIYGTYNPDGVPYPDAITIAAETTETLNVGESDAFTVSWEDGKVFDIDTLAWTSSDPSIISVEGTTKGATAHALATGEANISASDGTITSNSVALTVEDVLQESETIDISDYGGSGANVDSQTITGHQVSITIAKGTGNTSPRWDSNLVRLYTANTITFTPLYDNATISKIEFVCDSSYYGNDAAELTDASGNIAGTITNPKSSGCTITIDNITSTGVLTFTNWLEAAHTSTSNGTQLRFTSITIGYTLTA